MAKVKPLPPLDRNFEKLQACALLPDGSIVFRLSIRPNNVLVRPWVPEGDTKGGLHVWRNPNHARVWGHVLLCDPSQSQRVVPGDFVLFKRYSDLEVADDAGLPIVQVNLDDLVAIVNEACIPLAV